jgi:hypothetical protein
MAFELNAERAEQALCSGIGVIQCNTLDAHATVESFSLLYLNPPYDSAIVRGHPISIWTTMVQRLGLSAVPEWADYMIAVLESHG